jgi:adenosylcobinamide-phosphate guanylyltransferase
MTMNWCRANGITVCKAGGSGYIEDMISAVKTMDERYPVFISVADIPCVTPGIIRMIARAYYLSGKDGCSTWIPATLVPSSRGGMPYRKMVNGNEACPAGINILRGDLIDQPQDELQILLDDPGLSLNVNTLADRTRAEYFLKRKSL